MKSTATKFEHCLTLPDLLQTHAEIDRRTSHLLLGLEHCFDPVSQASKLADSDEID